MADAGDGAQAQHHLLVDVQDGDQQEQGPQQVGAVVLARLAVGGERAGVVVADHDDQAGADDRQQRLELGGPAGAGRGVVEPDGAERTLDIADVGVVQHGGAGCRGSGFCGRVGHDVPPQSPRRGWYWGHAAVILLAEACRAVARHGAWPCGSAGRGRESAQGRWLPRAGPTLAQPRNFIAGS